MPGSPTGPGYGLLVIAAREEDDGEEDDSDQRAQAPKGTPEPRRDRNFIAPSPHHVGLKQIQCCAWPGLTHSLRQMADQAPLQGELQIQIMAALWRIESGTVEEVRMALPTPDIAARTTPYRRSCCSGSRAGARGTTTGLAVGRELAAVGSRRR
jgi:hypothetical protein